MTQKNKNKLWAAFIVGALLGAGYSIVGLICLLGWKGLLVVAGVWCVYRLWKAFYDEMNKKDGIS